MRCIHILSDRKSRWRFVCALVVFLLTMTGVWILNLLQVIGGSWSTVLNAIFTGLGSIIAFLQWHEQATAEASCTVGLSAPSKADPQGSCGPGLVNKRKGGIVVYAPRTWRGMTLYLLAGLQETTGPIEAASNVVERRSSGQCQFISHFLGVSPGHYTLVALSRRRWAQVTIHAGHLSEIDWR